MLCAPWSRCWCARGPGIETDSYARQRSLCVEKTWGCMRCSRTWWWWMFVLIKMIVKYQNNIPTTGTNNFQVANPMSQHQLCLAHWFEQLPHREKAAGSNPIWDLGHTKTHYSSCNCFKDIWRYLLCNIVKSKLILFLMHNEIGLCLSNLLIVMKWVCRQIYVTYNPTY